MSTADPQGDGRAPWAGIALAAAGALYVWLQVIPPLGSNDSTIPGLAAHANDFKHLYVGASLIRNGLSPYDVGSMHVYAAELGAQDPRFHGILPYVYLPFTGIVLAPLTWLPFWKAVIAFQLINHAAILAALGLLARFAPEGRRLWCATVLVVAAALSIAVTRQTTAGQLNAILLLCWAGFATLTAGRAPAAARGALAAFATLFKLSPGILFPWMLLRRRAGEAWAMATAAVAMLVATLPIAGPSRYLEFLPQLRDMGYGRSTWSQLGHTFWRDPYNQSINAMMHRCFVDFPGSGVTPWLSLPHGAANAMTWLASLGVLAALARGVLRAPATPAGENASLACAICASLLLPSLMWDHYLVQLFAPVGLLWWSLPGDAMPARIGLAVSVIIAGLPIPFQAPVFSSGPGLLVMSAKLLPVLIVFGISVRACLAHGRTAHD